MGVSEEARIRADKETQESWEVVMNSNIPDVTDEEQLIFFEVCIDNLFPRCFDSGSNGIFVMHVSGRVQATNFKILRIIKSIRV